MAHWNEERDARWVEMMRATKLRPDLVDLFEKTGDIIYWDQFCREIKTRRP